MNFAKQFFYIIEILYKKTQEKARTPQTPSDLQKVELSHSNFRTAFEGGSPRITKKEPTRSRALTTLPMLVTSGFQTHPKIISE